MRKLLSLSLLTLVLGCTSFDKVSSSGGPGAGGSGNGAGGSSNGAGGSSAGGSSPGGPGGVNPSPLATVPGHESLLQDTSPKQRPRLMPPEAYIRSMLHLFGGLAPPEMQAKIKAVNGSLFDTWNDYLAALGLPEHRLDVPRTLEANALMVATFERVGIALCALAIQNDLKGATPPPVDKRVVFAFEVTKDPLTEETFAARFDVLHRTFLGYPAKLSPVSKRQERFFKIYTDTVAAHQAKDAPKGFTPEEAGWAAVCYGLVRHPEFHLY